MPGNRKRKKQEALRPLPTSLVVQVEEEGRNCHRHWEEEAGVWQRGLEDKDNGDPEFQGVEHGRPAVPSQQSFSEGGEFMVFAHLLQKEFLVDGK